MTSPIVDTMLQRTEGVKWLIATNCSANTSLLSLTHNCVLIHNHVHDHNKKSICRCKLHLDGQSSSTDSAHATVAGDTSTLLAAAGTS
jgi:hypothetical protein